MSVDVSVVIPSHNRAALIGETIESILNQTHPPAEILVVDDGSTDDTAAVLARYGKSVRYHWTENVGPAAARNIGASLALGSWIALCDSDDLWLTTKLERQLRIHALCPAVEYSFTDFVPVMSGVWQSSTVLAEAPEGFWDAGRREVESHIWVYDDSLYDRFVRFQPMFPSTLLISKRRFESIGGFNEQSFMGVCDDFEFGLRNAGVPPIGILAEAQVGIRKHAGNRSYDYVAAWLSQAAILEYALTAHPAARAHADIVWDEIQKKRVLAAGGAFAFGRLDVVRALAPLIPLDRRDWKLSLKTAVARLPMPLAKLLRYALVTANKHIARLV